MNGRERAILRRLHTALHDVPLPQDGIGTQSSTVEGFITYAKDAREIHKVGEEILYQCLTGEFDVAEQQVTILEEWIQQRRAKNWQDEFPFPQIRKQVHDVYYDLKI